MDYRIRPPTNGFDRFAVHRQVESKEVEIHVLDGSYVFDLAEAAKWMLEAGFRAAHKVLDVVHNVRIVECDIPSNTYSVPENQDVTTEEAEEVNAIVDCVMGQRVPFDPANVHSPFDQQIGFHRPSHYVNPRSNRHGQ